MIAEEACQYLSGDKKKPFFYAVGDDYRDVLSELKDRADVVLLRVSDFCCQADNVPNMDAIVDRVQKGNDDSKTYLLIGLGEYLALQGRGFARKNLCRWNSVPGRVLLLLRASSGILYEALYGDPRVEQECRVYCSPTSTSKRLPISVSLVNRSFADDAAHGIKELLAKLEDGATGACQVSSSLNFPHSTIPISQINTAFAALQTRFAIPWLNEKWGDEKQWESLFQEMLRLKNLDSVFSAQQIHDDFLDEFYDLSTGTAFKNWLFFLFLKRLHFNNRYLKFVVENSESLEAFQENLLTAIIDVPRDDPRFGDFYRERKKLLRNFKDHDLALFLSKNRIDYKESVYRLTDLTECEREETVKWIAQFGYVKELETIYPALALYLSDYAFNCGSSSALLTEYFKRYRYQKVENRIDPSFLETVHEFAQSLPYASLETRDVAIQRVENKSAAILYWLDALGVEFLPYIAGLAEKKRLALRVDMTYCNLPTLTRNNRKFYEDWSGLDKKSDKDLDELKHNVNHDVNKEKCDAPIHLVKELAIVENVIERAAQALNSRQCQSFIIASDHGASRLAVLHNEEEKYEADAKGEHNGRCCEATPNAKPPCPYALYENGYFVLADYGRIKGGKAANVEVHGGATLEEVVVPVITLTLKKSQAKVELKVIKPETIVADRVHGVSLTLYVSYVENVDRLEAAIDGKRYRATRTEDGRYRVTLRHVKRAAKKLTAQIYDGDNLVGNVVFSVKGALAENNDDFDSMFDEDHAF